MRPLLTGHPAARNQLDDPQQDHGSQQTGQEREQHPPAGHVHTEAPQEESS